MPRKYLCPKCQYEMIKKEKDIFICLSCPKIWKKINKDKEFVRILKSKINLTI